jgi:hypothetical protein
MKNKEDAKDPIKDSPMDEIKKMRAGKKEEKPVVVEKKPEITVKKTVVKQEKEGGTFSKKLMRTKNSLHHSFAFLAPPSYRASFKNNLPFADIDAIPEEYIGRIMLRSLIPVFITLGILLLENAINTPFLSTYIDRPIILGIGVGIFLLIHLLYNLYIYFRITRRTKGVERVLPDALQLTAANIRAGMTPFLSLRTAARPEFGVLAKELILATNKSMGSTSFADALEQISKRVKSNSLRRVVRLFITGSRSGGRIAELLESTAKDLIESEALRQELITSVKLYSTFVLFVVVLAMPVLLNISIHFTSLISNLESTLGLESGGQSFLKTSLVSKVAVTTDFLRLIAMASMISAGFLSSILLGIIKEGSRRYGMKFVPLVWIGSFLVYFLSDSVVGSFLKLVV